MAIVARDDPNTAYLVFMLVMTSVGIGLLEFARRHQLHAATIAGESEPVAP